MTNRKKALDAALLSLCSQAPPRGVSGEVGLASTEQLLARHMSTGGKRLRGLLPWLVVTEEGGDTELALRFGAAVEAIHNGTLVHDDIQDGDTLRRGQPTLWTEVGIPQAINAGDVFLVAPIAGLLADASIEDRLARALTGLLAGALLETIRGQIADVGVRDRERVNLQVLSGIACAKTSPLFAAGLEGAALILGADAARQEAARACGHRLGLAFQVRDDLLDMVGTKGRGEPGSDLREGKPTWPLLAACEGADEEDIAAIRQLLKAAADGTAPSADEVARWVAWVQRRGGTDAARSALREALDDAENLGKSAFPQAHGVVSELCERLGKLDG